MSANAEKTTPASADTVTIEIDGRSIEAKKGQMLIQAADDADIYIPRFCYYKKLSIAANCRMCLVEIEKSPKPMPACATPVVEGMKVFTRSETARTAQKGVMEFLLINHPLDCPICDQGGECKLQNLAVGYGNDISRFSGSKRILKDQDLGPLISTDMTRCIHCTRCIRFGVEIAGIQEMGATGRGEHTRIGTYIEKSIDSELSGNIIDLCPVGALTSKPYRYSARPWELTDKATISPHDCVHANINVQTRGKDIMRVVPRENEAVNETWLADRDRFSYEGLNAEQRLTAPMIKIDGQWQETDWNTALEFVVRGISKVKDRHGDKQIGALAAPSSTTEEFYLLQKLMRALGSNNVDHRVRQQDCADDNVMPAYPGLGQSLAELELNEVVLLIGSNVRKDQPLIGSRLRKAAGKGCKLMSINPVDYDFTSKFEEQVIANPQGMLESLAGVVLALAKQTGKKLDSQLTALLKGIDAGPEETNIAGHLVKANNASLLIGNYGFIHPQSSHLRLLANWAAELSGAKLGFLADANSVGAWLAGCVPHRGPHGAAVSAVGADAYCMIKEPIRAYILLGLEPELDIPDGGRTRAALKHADFVAMLSVFKPDDGSLVMKEADTLLPIAPFTETDGAYVNCEGRVQSFEPVTGSLGDSRPAWKVLRVLANVFDLDGFDFQTLHDVRAEMGSAASLENMALSESLYPDDLGGKVVHLCRISEVPMYSIDATVRRAPALQATHDNPGPALRISTAAAEQFQLSEGDRVRARMLEGDAELDVMIDDRIPTGCAWIPVGFLATSTLGASGPVTVSKL